MLYDSALYIREPPRSFPMKLTLSLSLVLADGHIELKGARVDRVERESEGTGGGGAAAGGGGGGAGGGGAGTPR
eukprot:2646540-Rhodomonas_salina.1